MVLEQEVRTKDRIVRELQRQVRMGRMLEAVWGKMQSGTVEDVMYIIYCKFTSTI